MDESGMATPRASRMGRIALSLGAAALVALALFLVWREGRSSREPAGLSPAFQYDLESLRQVDPALIAYSEKFRVASGLQDVRGLALAPDGALWVAGESILRRFDAQGVPQADVDLQEDVRCVACNHEWVYVGLTRRLVILDASGKETARGAELASGTLLTSIAVHGPDLYLADSGRRLVLHCDLAGKVLSEIGARDAARGVPGLIVPSPYLDVAAGEAEVVYVTNPGRHQVETYTSAGERIGGWGHAAMRVEGFSGCCNPVAIVRLPGGRIVVSEKGLARVKVMDRDGKLECLVAAPSSFGENAFGIDLAADREGRVYVLDTGSRAVRIFEPHPQAIGAAQNE